MTHTRAYHRVFAYPFSAHMDQHKSLVLHRADEINLFLRGAKQDSRLFIYVNAKNMVACWLWGLVFKGDSELSGKYSQCTKSTPYNSGVRARVYMLVVGLAAMGDQDPAKKKDAFCPGKKLRSFFSCRSDFGSWA